MNYPNGSLNLNKLKEMVSSKDYNVYYETKEEKESNWNFLKHGIKRGTRTEIKDVYELMTYLSKELNNEGTICYDFSDNFFEKHPHIGEEIEYVRPTFLWEYQSYETKVCYKICECTYLGEKPKYPSLELRVYDNGFEGSCLTVASWEKKEEGYEFYSLYSRFFEYVEYKDLLEVWKAIKKADEFLNERFSTEEHNV